MTMCNWPKWILPGIAAILLLTGLAAFTRREPVEADLKDRAIAALQAGSQWAAVDADGRDLTLSGQAADESEIAAAVDAAKSVSGVRRVANAATLPPVASPWLLEAERSDGNLVLSGHYTTDAARAAIRAAAEAAVSPGEVEDRRTQARGAPADFEALATFALAQLANLSAGKVSLSDQVLSISGRANSVDDHEKLVSALAGGLPPSAKLAAITVEPATISPYEFRVRKEAGRIAIEGYVPDDATRQAIAGAAKIANPGFAVEDSTRIAAGVPEGLDWKAAGEFLVARLGSLTSGTASVVGSDFSIDGRAVDTPAFEEIGQALSGELPAGLVLANVAIGQPVISPWTWSLKGEANSLTVAGYAPDKATAQQNVAGLKTRFGAAMQIVDEQKLGAGAPDAVTDAYALAMQVAGRLENPSVQLSDKSLRISGEALTGVAANEIRTALAKSLPAGWRADAEIAVRPAAEFVDARGCQDAINGVMKGNVIRFASGSAEIEDNSFGLLDRLVYSIRRCPELQVEIGGHTDSDGEDGANLILSEQRANAVSGYLVRAGVLYSRLLPKGFGETRPIASNDTAEGKAANRRIEFTVVQ
jgi:OOP family OmpA-OmpF porin